MISFITEKKTIWDKMKDEVRPIFIYGMGNVAQKLIDIFIDKGITISGIFASDDFVRNHYFEGYRVHKLSEVEENVDNFIIVLAFAAGYQELVNKIKELSKRHTLYVPDIPVTGDSLFTYEFCQENAINIRKVYDILEDDFSRQVYKNIINFKISGNIDYLTLATTPKSEIYHKIITPHQNETYVDIGAYNGDTIREIIDYTHGRYNKIYALEPDYKNFKKLVKFVAGMSNVYVYNIAAWCVDTILPFSSKAGRQSTFSARSKNFISARSIDNMLNRQQPITIIKIDIEGFEREAIWGAVNTIEHYSPKLIISLYHRNEDIFELPLLIKMINPNYKLYIRHQLYIPAWETNLYAIM